MLYSEFVKKPILLLSILIALHFGVLAVAITLPINALIELIINSVLSGKTFRYHLGEILLDFLPATVLSVVMGAVVYGISLLPWNNLIVQLFAQVIVGGVCYILLSLCSHNQEFYMIFHAVSRKQNEN
jgi:hypothetical protein